MNDAPVRLAVILGSTRDGRFGDKVAGWFVQSLEPRSDFDVDFIDLREAALPATQSGAHPKSGRYGDATRSFAERIAAADAYVFVTPEYNHGYPAALKLAIDSVYAEWGAKPASFVSYGGLSGGVRAVEQLRQVLVELHVVPVRDAVALPMAWQLVGGDGDLVDNELLAGSVKTMLDTLRWWALALRDARTGRPYAA